MQAASIPAFLQAVEVAPFTIVTPESTATLKYLNLESEWSNLMLPGDNEVMLLGIVVELGTTLQATGIKEYQTVHCL